MDRLSDVEVLVRVIETGSFTAAARELGISKSYASKQVRALEERLGARLLNRTTRTLTPTEAGRNFATRCAALLDELSDAERSVSDLQRNPRGVLRMTLPTSFGVSHVAPQMGTFLAAHPDLQVVADFSDRRVDLVDEGFDLAIRVGKLGDSSLIGKKLAPSETVMVASPAYLQRKGTPQRPEDLREHDALIYNLLATPTSWTLSPRAGKGNAVRVRVTARMDSNSGTALLQAAIAGVGIVDLPDFMVHQAVRSGQVVPVLPAWTSMPGGGIWAVYPHGRHLAAKVRLLVDHLASAFEKADWRDGLVA